MSTGPSGPGDLWNWLYLATTYATVGDPNAVRTVFSAGDALATSFLTGAGEFIPPFAGVSSIVPDSLLDAFETTYGIGASNPLWNDLGFLERYIDDVFLLTGDDLAPMTIVGDNPALSRGRNGAADLVIGTNASETIAGSDGDEIFLMNGGADSIMANGGADLVIAGNANTTIDGGEGNDFLMGDRIVFSGLETGHDVISGGEGNDTIYGMFGNDTITGGLFDGEVNDPDEDNDLIYGGLGNDLIFDSLGQDTLYAEGGNDTIIQSHEASSDEPLEEGEEGFEAFEGPVGDLLFGGEDTDHLVLSEGGEIRLGLFEGQLGFAISSTDSKTDWAFQFEHIEGNGATLDLSGYGGDVTINWTAMTLELEDQIITFDGISSIFAGSGDTIIIGSAGQQLRGGGGDDVLFSGGGNTQISGGAGVNTLHALIGDEITGDADDILILNGVTITGDDVMFGAGQSYREAFTVNGPVQNTFYSATRGTERLLEVGLDLGFAVMVEPLLVQIEANGTWTSIKWQGYIVLEPDLDTHFDQDGKFIKSTADATIIFNMGDFGINSSGPFLDPSIGESYNARNLFENNEHIEFGLGPGDAPVGTPGIDAPDDPIDFYEYTGLKEGYIETILEAFDEAGIDVAPELIAGTSGDDFLFGDFRNQIISGEGGNDTIYGGRGDDYLSGNHGNDVYEFVAGDGQDTIYEGGGGTDKIVFAKRSAADMSVAKIDGNYVLSFENGDKVTIENPTHWTRVVETVEFDDAVLTFEEVAAIATTAMQTDGDDVVDGYDYDDVLTGGLGNDLLSGRHGDDTFIFGIGDGQDTVNDQGNGDDTLIFEGRVFADMTATRDGNDFILSFANGDSVTIYSPTHWTRTIENVTFDDGAFSFADIVAAMTAASQTDGDDVVDGYDYNDVIIGGLGNDTLSGRHGDDTFIFREGDGQDVINDNGNGDDSIVFEGRDFSDATITREADLDYVFTFANGDSVTIQNPTHWARIIENVVFDDRAFDFDAIAADVTTSEQTSGDDHVRGFSGNDTIIGGTGNDLLSGQHGDDTFIFRVGDGDDTVSDGGNGTDILVFEGRNLADVTATQSGNDLILSFGNGDSVTIQSPTHWTRIIENVSFDDTQVMVLDELFA